MIRQRCLAAILLWMISWLAPSRSPALGPHEIALLVNSRSAASIELANRYAELRDIPSRNIIHLPLPEAFRDGARRIDPDDFATQIYAPTMAEIQRRGLHGHILAWAYSLDFPLRIRTEPPMSLTGLTFTRGEVPPSETIKAGTYTSLLYRGPDKEGGPRSPSLSLEQFAQTAGTNMPLPSMMLGYTGARGLTLAEAINILTNSVRGDALSPPGWVYFIEKPGDPRSDCRAWQFAEARAELQTLGIAARQTDTYPGPDASVIGLMTGQANLPDRAFTARFAPGAFAEHLTSWGAEFVNPQQTKATEWLRHGAAGTAGTVTEPYALWTKFPHARVFAHYASGCTLLEALVQSIRCPLQILLLGDPLASPWHRPPLVTLISMDDDLDETPLRGAATFLASVLGADRSTFLFLLNGRPVPHPGNQPRLTLDTRQLADGYHEVRVVAYAEGPVRHQAFDQLGFTVRNRGRSVALVAPPPEQRHDLHTPLEVRLSVTAPDQPSQIAVVRQERILARSVPRPGEPLAVMVDPSDLGPGPVHIQGVAVFGDRHAVRSEPVRLDLVEDHQPPEPGPITRQPGPGAKRETLAIQEVPEGTRVSWQVALPLGDAKDLAGHAAVRVREGLEVEPQEDGVRLTAADHGLYVLDVAFPDRLTGLETEMTLGRGADMPEQAGLIFGGDDARNYTVVRYERSPSIWRVARIHDGKLNTLVTRGVPVPTNPRHRLRITRVTETSVVVNINQTLSLPLAQPLTSGGIGWMVQKGTAHIRTTWISPPDVLRDAYRTSGNTLERPLPDEDLLLDPVRAVVQRGNARTIIPIPSRDPPSP